MERSKIEQFMLLNAGNFNESDLLKIQNRLEAVPEEYATMVLGTEFKKPTTSLIISFLGGGLGIDRFYLGQTGKGILKLITCGGFGIWAIIDLFIIMGAAKDYNTIKLINVINKYTSKKSEKAATETRPSNEAYQPRIESARSSDEAYQPRIESTSSSDEAYQPKTEPTRSSDEAYQPKTDPTSSSDEAYQPRIESTSSSDEVNQPIEEPKLDGNETSASN